MSRVFITGVAGFLGSHLADAMLADGHTVIGIDNLIGGERANVPLGVSFGRVDCTDFTNVKRFSQNCDIVFHCAATAYEGLSVFSPSLISRNIVDASVTVFSAAIANRAKRIVHCSSMARYGSQVTPFVETMPTRPEDPYGIAKVASEQMLKNLCITHDVDYVIAVPHNIIGPRQKYDDPFRNVASIMMNLMLQKRSPIIYGDGTQQRCFSYIDDCLSCLKTMAYSTEVRGQTINIGPDENPVTINKLYETIANVIGYSGEPTYMPGRPREVKVAICSSNKARRMLGYKTTTTLEQGLALMASWMRFRGTKKFNYHLPLEIVTDKTPKTWTDRLF
jgi:UDP-glucose 4-epimerase